MVEGRIRLVDSIFEVGGGVVCSPVESVTLYNAVADASTMPFVRVIRLAVLLAFPKVWSFEL